MRKPYRFIRPLTKEEIELLEGIFRSHSSFRTRCRAHAVLLSNKKWSVKDIASILSVTNDTVEHWLTAFEEQGEDGLNDSEKSGRPRALSQEDRDLLEKIAENHPQNPIKKFRQKRPKLEVSDETIRGELKGLGFRHKRHRLSLRGHQNEEAFQEAKDQLHNLLEKTQKGEIELYFGDESGFSLNPAVPYGWQPKGTTIPLPSHTGNHSKRANVVGFMRACGKKLVSAVFEGRVDAEVFDYMLDQFKADVLEKTTKPVVVILDNASIHRSDEIEDKIEELESSFNVTFKFIPPYSPELNYIEILWKQIKHHWLEIGAYKNFDTLLAGLVDVIASFGDEYSIKFKQAT